VLLTAAQVPEVRVKDSNSSEKHNLQEEKSADDVIKSEVCLTNPLHERNGSTKLVVVLTCLGSQTFELFLSQPLFPCNKLSFTCPTLTSTYFMGRITR